jgi:adenine deaminase
MLPSFTLEGLIVLPYESKIVQGAVVVKSGKIEAIIEKEVSSRSYIMPGLVDAHVHIESSMLVPSEFARAAVVHGTTATISDPHEIANVLGVEGVEFMIRNGDLTPFRFFFGAPSCVPATPLETSGAVIDDQGVQRLLENEKVVYLAEVMNFPGVVFEDPQVMAKLAHARALNKPVDGHAPGLSGEQLKKYAGAGITTDHECFSLEEAREKASLGMKILIREGSAARNFDDLIPLLIEFPDQVMLCSDDKHPDDLLNGHINLLIQRGLQLGYPLLPLVRACTVNPALHYRIPVGLLRVGDPADLIVVSDAESFRIQQTYIAGEKVASDGQPLFPSVTVEHPNRFAIDHIDPAELAVPGDHGNVRVIGAIDGQLITKQLEFSLPVNEGLVMTDPSQDVLKIVVLNRYQKAPPAVGFIHGFGLNRGAIASTVAHDSHNVIAVGVDDKAICQAIRMLIDSKGGLAAVDENSSQQLELPVAGIMGLYPVQNTAWAYKELDAAAKNLGSKLTAPFMTLSFMALLVIPELKLGDKGLFDGNSFSFTNLFVEDDH